MGKRSQKLQSAVTLLVIIVAFILENLLSAQLDFSRLCIEPIFSQGYGGAGETLGKYPVV